MAGLVITVSPHVRPDGREHPNAFDAYLGERLVVTSETPLFSSARILLEDRTAHPDDVLGGPRPERASVRRPPPGPPPRPAFRYIRESTGRATTRSTQPSNALGSRILI